MIDGQFDEWETTPNLEKASQSAAEAEFRIRNVATHHDLEHVYFMIEIDRIRSFQGLEGTLELHLNVDSDPKTGSLENQMGGIDAIVLFTPPNPINPSQRGMGVGVRIPNLINPNSGASIPNHADIGFLMAPTYASDQLEFSIPRDVSLPGVLTFFRGESFSYRFALVSRDASITETTSVFTHSLHDTRTEHSPIEAPVMIPEKDNEHLRLMTWNVENGTILKKPNVYSRILTAVNPDVILFQELTRNETRVALGDLLNHALPMTDKNWHVMLGGNGNALGCGIAARFPLQRVNTIETIPYPNRPEWTVRALGASLTTQTGQRLLVTSIHLKCCGRLRSSEDQTRFLEAAAINTTIKELGDRFEGIVMGGDLNLVGSYDPIERLGKDLETNKTDLEILDPYQLDGRSNATWPA